MSTSAFEPMPRVLLVEDDEPTRRILLRELRSYCDVTAAEDGDQALVAAISSPPALIVTDVFMPGIDGVTMINLLRKLPALASVPVVFMTSSGDKDIAIHALQAHARCFLQKPFSLERFHGVVRRALGMTPRQSATPE